MAALNVRCERTIQRSPQEVWTFVAQDYFANHHQWDPAVVAMESLTSGPVRVGTAGVETRRFMGRQKARFEITEFSAQSAFGLKNTSGPFHLDRRYLLSAAPEGTTVVFTFQMRPKGPAKIVFPLVRSVIERQVEANIDRLQHVLSTP